MVFTVHCREAPHVVEEIVHQREELLLAHEARWPGGPVHDTKTRLQLDVFRKIVAVAASEEVDDVPPARQVARHLGAINVLAATVDATRSCERRRVLADDRYLPNQD